MPKHIPQMEKVIALIMLFFAAFPTLGATPSQGVHVDNNGVLRDGNNNEVAYYGTNYTVPFAHAYRALTSRGIDPRAAIDRDTYHMARMGLNAFRLHLWDVELTDSIGNITPDNPHLDLLDYLISRLEDRGISVVITAQTNFGNGYPERNVNTGAYSYRYDKCDVHLNPEAQAAQERYLKQLARHTNPYTRKSYADDPAIIALEINNEPCHNGTAKQVTAYINRMAKALRKSGWTKPILYNVSHNRQVVEAYYLADIQGTTYQWYPTHLVAGHERRGNFLPHVDQYAIPFSNVKGFGSKAKFVYEFDPADVLCTYLYPAIARTLRREGFQWITQFAYDPIDIAPYNTEYQTHYLNLAYTPGKALGMKIAAEVTRNIERSADFGGYPTDTVFGDFRVSHHCDLAEYNTPDKFFYTNSTNTAPVAPTRLAEIAGHGNSPIVKYSGTGAYMLDRIDRGVWRLEVMPDIILTRDPFATPAPNRRVGDIIYREQPMTIALPELGQSFVYQGINNDNTRRGTAKDATFAAYPGVYLLAANGASLDTIDCHERLGNIFLDEYVAPTPDKLTLTVLHTPQDNALRGDSLTVRAIAYGAADPDSLVVYPADVSMWRNHNTLYKMHRVSAYQYEARIPARGSDRCQYNIVAFGDSTVLTYPGAVAGTPLDWYQTGNGHYAVGLYSDGDPVVLLSASDPGEMSTIPESWADARYNLVKRSPIDTDVMRLHITPDQNNTEALIQKYVAPSLASRRDLDATRRLVVSLGNVSGAKTARVAVVNSDGITYAADIPAHSGKTSLSINDLQQSTTALSPAPYPVFLNRYLTPQCYDKPLDWKDIEFLTISFPDIPAGTTVDADITGAWLE